MPPTTTDVYNHLQKPPTTIYRKIKNYTEYCFHHFSDQVFCVYFFLFLKIVVCGFGGLYVVPEDGCMWLYCRSFFVLVLTDTAVRSDKRETLP